ncbi:MAG: NAD(P)-binding domain-containing protein [Bacteroidota bacterium]
MNKKVCVIGAGSSGITACKALLEEGISFDCFEKGSGIGGNWRYNNDNEMSSAYRSLHINTNREVMSYSDFPMPKEYAMFPHHTEILKYFESYVDHFGICKHIVFNTSVELVEKVEKGGYLVTTSNGQTTQYESVIVANGHHWNPRYPEPSFPGNFTGETMHVHHYRTPEVLENKSIVILGFGNSAVDIACEAARLHTCKQVTIATRSGAYIVPNWIWSIPFDKLANPLTTKLPLAIQRLLLKATLWLARGNQEDFGVPIPNRPILSEHPTLSQDLLNLCGRGLIKIKPNIKEFERSKIIFEDGTSQLTDLLIYATGYKITFPFLKEGFFNVENSNDIQLYKRVVHPEHPGLYFLALIQPLGAIMPLAEIQSKWVAKLIKGDLSLPSKETQFIDIEKEKNAIQKRYKNSPRHTIQVDFFEYKFAIEKELKKQK